MAGKSIVAIAAVGQHSLALASDWRLFAWGDPDWTGTASPGLNNVTAAQDQWAWRAVFYNTSGSSITAPAVLHIVTWSGTLASATSIPNQAEGPVVHGTLDLHRVFAPAPGTSLMVLQNTGLTFINGNFDNIPQGGRITLSFGGVAHDFIANYYGGNGRSLVLTRPLPPRPGGVG